MKIIMYTCYVIFWMVELVSKCLIRGKVVVGSYAICFDFFDDDDTAKIFL